MDSVEQQPTMRRLHAALEGNQFRLHYQPQLEQSTGRVVGVEALLRWQDPAGYLHGPYHFLRSLESTGLIVAVGEWVFRQVTEDCRHWQRFGLPRLKVAVNVSPIQLYPSAAACLDRYIRELRCVCEPQIEVSIHHLLSLTPHMKPALEMLRRAGAEIAVQDFGIDSSLHQKLWALPVDTIKIHRDYIHRLTIDPEVDDKLAELFALTNSFKLGTVAEGVETHEQLKRLAQLNCERSQGFLHSAPMSAERIEYLLSSTCYTRPLTAVPRTGRLAYDA